MIWNYWGSFLGRPEILCNIWNGLKLLVQSKNFRDVLGAFKMLRNVPNGRKLLCTLVIRLEGPINYRQRLLETFLNVVPFKSAADLERVVGNFS